MGKVVIWKYSVRSQSSCKVILISDKISVTTSGGNTATWNLNDRLNTEFSKIKIQLSVKCAVYR